jgi:hypothetical protein
VLRGKVNSILTVKNNYLKKLTKGLSSYNRVQYFIKVAADQKTMRYSDDYIALWTALTSWVLVFWS